MPQWPRERFLNLLKSTVYYIDVPFMLRSTPKNSDRYTSPHAWKTVYFEYFFTRVPTSLINIKAKISHSTYLYSYQGSFMRWSRESFEGERIKIRFLKLLILLIILCRNMRTIISVHDVFIFVHFSMLAQSRVWYITLSTDIARKRSFASMQANMSYQRWIAFEGFVAIFADKWPFIYRFLV